MNEDDKTGIFLVVVLLIFVIGGIADRYLEVKQTQNYGQIGRAHV